MKSIKVALIIAITVATAAVLYWQGMSPRFDGWSESELVILQSLSLDGLPDLPTDPSNAVADNPIAAEFGRKLFFDARLSANGGISCATCHQAIRRFSDGLQKGQAIGTTDRHTPSIVGSAYSPWQFWDGRRDSQWSQALAPLEDPNEHAIDRKQVLALVAEDVEYKNTYEALFGDLPDAANADDPAINSAFANIGKSIAAFERTILPTASKFDVYVRNLAAVGEEGQPPLFDEDEINGLRLFIGEANCLQCHNGPLFTNHEFHNTGVISFPGEVPDKARVSGVVEVLQSEFNCRSNYSDDTTHQCSELDFARTGKELIGAFKTPSLRNLENTQPYMHKGQLATLGDVLRHYNEAPDAMIGHNEAKPLGLSSRELLQIEKFLHTLDAPVAGIHLRGDGADLISETRPENRNKAKD